MKHEEQEARVRENAQEQDRQNAIQRAGVQPQPDRRRFLKTGGALAVGGAVAYVAPSVSGAARSGCLSPCNVVLPLDSTITLTNAAGSLTEEIVSDYLFNGSFDLVIDADRNVTISGLNLSGTYESGEDHGLITIIQDVEVPGSFACKSCSLSVDVDATLTLDLGACGVTVTVDISYNDGKWSGTITWTVTCSGVTFSGTIDVQFP